MNSTSPSNLHVPPLAFIGAGAMAEALIRGILSQKSSPIKSEHGRSVIATDVREDRLQWLASELNIQTTLDNVEAAMQAQAIVIAVKPAGVCDVVRDIAKKLTQNHTLISIAAGVRMAKIREVLTAQGAPSEVSVVRVMPNTPALVGEGMSVLSAEKPDQNLDAVESIFRCVGKVARVDERALDAVTALSGSGPAYIFLVLESLWQAGVEAGLPSELARQLATQTLLGSAVYAEKSNQSPETLRNQVTSKGGTTAAGLEALVTGKIREAFVAAVAAAKKRSEELSA